MLLCTEEYRQEAKAMRMKQNRELCPTCKLCVTVVRPKLSLMLEA